MLSVNIYIKYFFTIVLIVLPFLFQNPFWLYLFDMFKKTNDSAYCFQLNNNTRFALIFPEKKIVFNIKKSIILLLEIPNVYCFNTKTCIIYNRNMVNKIGCINANYAHFDKFTITQNYEQVNFKNYSSLQSKIDMLIKIGVFSF